MRKDNTRDYVVSIFRFYSSMGKPNKKQINDLKEQLSTAAILDLMAVENTLCILKKRGYEDIIAAVKEIYFVEPERALRKNEISDRVTRFSMNRYIAIPTIYRLLYKARRICAEQRNLNILP